MVEELITLLDGQPIGQRRLKLAMKFGDTYSVRNIAARHFRELASALRLDSESELSRARALAEQMIEKVDVVREQTRRDGLQHVLLDRLSSLLSARARHCRELF